MDTPILTTGLNTMNFIWCHIGNIIKIWLRKLYSIDIALNGEEGLELYKKNKYDLILLDVNLGSGLNGLDIANYIRLEQKDKIPIIIITAFAMKDEIEYFKKFDVQEVLIKSESCLTEHPA